LYGRLPAAEFSPLKLKVVRDEMVRSGLSRPVDNSRIGVVFTSNEPAPRSQRFRERCGEMAFRGGSDHRRRRIYALLQHLWDRQGAGLPPGLDGLGMPAVGNVEVMTAAFRLAPQLIRRLLRNG
jgi:hypothetical protein